MKKTPKKLVLSRETVRSLADQELSKPRGADSSPNQSLCGCPTWYGWSCAYTCVPDYY
jgi:hypothetical protein